MANLPRKGESARILFVESVFLEEVRGVRTSDAAGAD
jgi:hypothetical protein